LNWREVLTKRQQTGALRDSSYESYMNWGRAFDGWLKAKGLDLDSLLLQCTTDEARSKAVDLVNEFVNVYHLHDTFNARKSILRCLSAIFTSCDRRLPFGRLVARHTREEILQGAARRVTITAEQFRGLVAAAATPLDRTVILILFQSFMDVNTFCKYFNYMWPSIREQVLRKEYPIRVFFVGGRKTNPLDYYTILERDAVEALYDYVTKYRPNGEPQKDEAIFIVWKGRNGKRGPVEEWTVNRAIKTAAYKAGYLKTVRGVGRTPFHAHELRDCAKTEFWRKAPIFDNDLEDVSEFLMGHVIDPLRYNKIMDDWEWVKKQVARIAPHINVISGETERLSKLEAQRMIIESQAKSQGLSVEDFVRKQIEVLGIKASIESEADLQAAIRLLFVYPIPRKESSGGTTCNIL